MNLMLIRRNLLRVRMRPRTRGARMMNFQLREKRREKNTMKRHQTVLNLRRARSMNMKIVTMMSQRPRLSSRMI